MVTVLQGLEDPEGGELRGGTRGDAQPDTPPQTRGG